MSKTAANRDRLIVAADLIFELADSHLETLVGTLTDREGMKIKEDKKRKVWTTAHLGIKGAPHPVQRIALHNWANAARRELRQAGVV